MAAKTEEVIQHVVLVLVDVAALPKPVAPLGQLAGKSRSAGTVRAAAPPGSAPPMISSAERPGVRPRRHGDPLAGEVEACAVPVAGAPHPVAATREQPRAPARNRPGGCRPRRASRRGSQARCTGGQRQAGCRDRPGPGADGGAARDRPGAPRRDAPNPDRAATGRPRLDSVSDTRSSVANSNRQMRGSASLEAQVQHEPAPVERHRRRDHRALDRRALLAREHTLGELQELVADLPVDGPRPPGAQQRPTGPVNRRTRTDGGSPQPAAQASAAPSHRLDRSRPWSKVLGHNDCAMPPFTKWSLNMSAFFTVIALCRPILLVMNENSRVDMHVHSTASELSKLGVQRSLNLPECATEPGRSTSSPSGRGWIS